MQHDKMDGLRRKALCVLSVAAFSICSCATSAKRLSDDLQSEGFTICICDDGEETTGPTVTVADAESNEKLLEWFRHRPHAFGDLPDLPDPFDGLEAAMIQQVLAEVPLFSLTTKIETTHFRVNLPAFPELPVVLETRATPADEWKVASWKMREEDVELQQWAIARITAEYKLLMERGQLDCDVSEE